MRECVYTMYTTHINNAASGNAFETFVARAAQLIRIGVTYVEFM